ncbi:MAG TPA: FliA/WhiG family RNA polymerase sigma factor [Pyrinomonadaceae bacterium]|nr:FliA/WhiG family RNA polymerase sigma factor [Pyrinomonadaceae bacterium]
MQASLLTTTPKMSRAATYALAQYSQANTPLTESERDALIESHLSLVKFVADRIAAKLPASVERDDLVSAGMIGLLDAVDKYDSSRGVMFKTYAEMRVRGAILDSLRDLDWAPRSMRRRAREIEAAYLQIEQNYNRPAKEEEVASLLGMSMPEFHRLLGDLRGLTVTGLDYEDDEDATTRSRQIPIDPAETPLAQYEQTETRERLVAAIDRLPERERQVMALYYLEELNMKEVGAVLSITESRVSQVHTQAIIRLRAALSPLRQSAKQTSVR